MVGPTSSIIEWNRQCLFSYRLAYMEKCIKATACRVEGTLYIHCIHCIHVGKENGGQEGNRKLSSAGFMWKLREKRGKINDGCF